MNYFTCSEGKIGPTLDLIYSGLSLVSAAVVKPSDGLESGISASQYRTIWASEGIIWGASGIYGYSKVSKCRDAKQELADRTNNNGGVRRRAPSASSSEEFPLVIAPAGVARQTRIVSTNAARVAPAGFSWTGLRPMTVDLATQDLPSRDRTPRDH
jgi:hypothetical protein